MKTRRLTVAALAAILPFVLVACGSNSAADHAKASLKTALLHDSTSANSVKFTDNQAGCIANALVDNVGEKQLKSQGVLDKSDNAVTKPLSKAKFTAPQATALVNTMFDCTGGGTTIVASLKKSIDTEVATAPAAVRACIDSAITTTFTRNLMAALFSRDQAKTAALQATLVRCTTAK